MAHVAEVETPTEKLTPDPTRVRRAVKRLRGAVREADQALAEYESQLNEVGIGLMTTAREGEGEQ